MVADLVGHKVDVIAAGGLPAAQAAKRATSTIPIVFSGIGDPIEVGLVATLARPAGNLTGISEMTTDLMSKRLQLLSELVPQATVIALLVNPTNANAEPDLREVQAPARAKGVQLAIFKAGTESEIDAAFAASRNSTPARSSSSLMHFLAAGASSSSHWHRAMPVRRSITCANSPLSAG